MREAERIRREALQCTLGKAKGVLRRLILKPRFSLFGRYLKFVMLCWRTCPVLTLRPSMTSVERPDQSHSEHSKTLVSRRFVGAGDIRPLLQQENQQPGSHRDGEESDPKSDKTRGCHQHPHSSHTIGFCWQNLGSVHSLRLLDDAAPKLRMQFNL